MPHFQALITSFLIWGLCLCSCALMAQGIGKSPQFYIEAQFARTTTVFHYPLATTQKFAIEPWLINIGYWLSSRLRVQAGVACHYGTYESTSTGTTATGLAFQGYFGEDTRRIAVPVLLCYALKPTIASRWNVDVIGGLIGVQARYESSIVETTNNVVTRRYNAADKAWNILGTVGLGSQFKLNQHFAVVADAALCRNVSATISTVAYQAVGAPTGFTSRFGLGLRYSFNLKKSTTIATVLDTSAICKNKKGAS